MINLVIVLILLCGIGTRLGYPIELLRQTTNDGKIRLLYDYEGLRTDTVEPTLRTSAPTEANQDKHSSRVHLSLRSLKLLSGNNAAANDCLRQITRDCGEDTGSQSNKCRGSRSLHLSSKVKLLIEVYRIS